MPGHNRLNLALLIAFALLAAVIFFSEEENTALQKLSEIDSDSIDSITIQHNKNITQLSRNINSERNSQWQITQPLSVAANNFRIQSLLKLLQTPVHNKYSEVEIDLKASGLVSSQTSIQFNDELISFGIINPASNLRFIKRGEFVYTIEDVYSPLLSANFSALVSLDLLPANSQIEKLILLNQTISKNEKSFWQSNISISADNIEIALDHWQRAQAFGIHPYMQREELADIFIFLQGQEQAIHFVVTDIDPWLILARPELGLEYHLNIETYDQLIAPQ